MVFELIGNDFELFGSIEPLRENHVSACIDIGFGSFDALIEPIDSFGVSPCADDEFSI